MTTFFPRHTVNWRLEEPPALRRLSLWFVPMGLLVGVTLRLLRAALLGSLGQSWGALGFYYGVTGLVFLAALAVHLANYPLRQWLWRVPAFVAVEALAEATTSAGLIAMGREPLGTMTATWADWPSLAIGGLWYRGAAAVLFSLVLAAVVAAVRLTVLRREEAAAMEDEANRETGAFRRVSIEGAGPIERVLKH